MCAQDEQVTYDAVSSCFRVHCHRDNQAEIMFRVKMIVDDILKGGEMPGPTDVGLLDLVSVLESHTHDNRTLKMK